MALSANSPLAQRDEVEQTPAPVTVPEIAAAPAEDAPSWLPQPRPRRSAEWIVALAVIGTLHGAVAHAFANTKASNIPTRLKTRVRVSVARPPTPVKPPEVPPQSVQPPKPVVRQPRKKLELPPPPQPRETPPPEAPPPAEPVLATTEATDPGAVAGSINGSVTGTGVVGGTKEGRGAAPPPPPPAPIVAAHEGANYLKNPRPAYPELALRRGWEGSVLLRVHVSAAGRPEAVAIKRSSGRDVLDAAAVQTVKTWTFVAARQGAAAVAGWVDVPIVFKLQQE